MFQKNEELENRLKDYLTPSGFRIKRGCIGLMIHPLFICCLPWATCPTKAEACPTVGGACPTTGGEGFAIGTERSLPDYWRAEGLPTAHCPLVSQQEI